MSKTINVYLSDADDFDCEGLGTLCPLDWEHVNKGINGAILKITHPYDAEGRWQWLQAGYIVRADVPVRTVPEIDAGALVATAETWTVKAGATKAQRYIYSSKVSGKGKKKKLVPAGAQIAVTYKGTDRYAVQYRAQVKNRKKWVWKCWSGWMDPAALNVRINTLDTSTVAKVEQSLPSVQVRPQLFRLQQPKRKEKTIEIEALPLAYDAAGILTDPFTGSVVTGPQALQRILDYTYMDTDLELATDIGDSRTGFDKRNVNCIDALLNGDDSFVGRWGGDVLIDDNRITILRSAGVDRGFYATYGRNLTGVDSYEISDDVVTAILPVGENADGTPLYLDGQKYVTSANYDQFPTPHMMELKVSDAKVDKKGGVSVALARTRMRAAVAAEWEKGVHIPAITLKIDYAMLGDSEEYRAFRDIDQCHMYDIVHVWHPLVCGYVDMAVCECTWNGMKERYTETTLGTPGGTLSGVRISAGSISGSISGRQLAWGAVGAGQLASDSIDTRHLQADSVNADAMQANSVTANAIAAGAVTTGKLDAGAVTADKLAANAVTASKIDANSVSAAVVETDAFEAATADIAQAEIGSADIDFAQIKDANVEQLIAQDAVTGRYYIRKLQVDNAQMVQATVGALVVKASDGKYYRLDFDSSGNLTPTEVTLTQGEITAGETADGRGSIIETDLTVTDLAASNMKAINALIDTLTAGRLYANQAFIDELHTSLITDDDFVNVVVGVGNAQSAAEAAQQDIDNLSVGGRNFILSSEAVRAHTRTMSAPYTYGWQPDNPWLLSDYAKGMLNAAGYPETLMLSFEARSSQTGAKLLMGVKSDTSQTGYEAQNIALKTAWDKYTATLTRKDNSDSYVLTRVWPMVTPASAGEITIEVRRMKLELGNRSTDWAPAPEDTDADITAAQTTADGAASAASVADGKAVAAQTAADGAAADAAAAQATADAKADPMTATAHGSVIVVSDSADAAIGGLVIYGRSEQDAPTTGKNLLPYEVSTPATPNGVTINILPDGGLKIAGTTTALATYMFHAKSSVLNVPAGTYRFLLTGSGTGFTGSNILLQLYTDTGSGLTSRFTSTDRTYTIGSDVVADYVCLRIASGVKCDCVVYPMLILSTETDTTFEKYTGAMPTPNPRFPSLIRSAGMTTGKNLLEFKRGETTTGGVTFSPQPDGSLRIWGTASAVTQYNVYTDYTILNLPHGMYRFYLTGSGTNVGDVKMLLYVDNNDGSGPVVASGWQNTDRIYTVRDSAIADFVRIRVSAGTYDCIVYPMVLPAYTDDVSFEAYSGGPVGTQIVLTCADDAQGNNATHTAIPTPNGLPGIAVSSGGNYTDEDGQQWVCDTIDLAAGTYTKRCGMTTFGALTWENYTHSVLGMYFRADVTGLGILREGAFQTTAHHALTSHYQIVARGSLADKLATLDGPITQVTQLQVKDSTYSTADSFKAAMSDVPFVYLLATPVTTPLTEAQLTALRSIRTRAGSTVLTNDADADMDLTYATQTGGGSYVEGVRQGLDDGIERAQGAADAAQVTADAAREDFRRVVRIDTEGLHVGDSQTSNEVMIDSESVNVVLGGRKYSKFAGDYVQFGDYQLRRSVDGGLVFKKA